jgi:hypothetical protein
MLDAASVRGMEIYVNAGMAPAEPEIVEAPTGAAVDALEGDGMTHDAGDRLCRRCAIRNGAAFYVEDASAALTIGALRHI